MSISNTIGSFQKVLSNFRFSAPSSFSEDFAQKRFNKKFEKPNSDHQDALRSHCWESWLSNDENLPRIFLPSGEWYKCRHNLHRCLPDIRVDDFTFPKGSEWIATRGQNSIEARLARSRWTCTNDNWGLFSSICYRHKALKRAVRRRYNAWYQKQGFDLPQRSSDTFLYDSFRHDQRGVGFAVFQWKLSRLTEIVHGSRFSTVPKNNEKVRPINIEPFGNILTQRSIGLSIRAFLLSHYDIDLDKIPDLHKVRIKNVDEIATIDLKDASDSISMDLVRFLLPKRIVSLIEKSRSDMVLGPDDNYHVIKKVSSMGNGFTFELMTLILFTICRVLDDKATVFGDDIIINIEKSNRLIELLQEVGLKVNTDKSFTDGPFRESCGANYHRDEGYVESFDFLWPESPGDCVVLYNKCVRLSLKYPSFKKLKDALYRSVPEIALQQGYSREFVDVNYENLLEYSFNENGALVPSLGIPSFYVCEHEKQKGGIRVPKKFRRLLAELCYDPRDFTAIVGYEFRSELASPTRAHLTYHWAKYEMYLSAGRKAKDVLTSKGKWVEVLYLTSAHACFRASALG